MAGTPMQPLRSVLGRHRLLAPTAGVNVSPLCLGAMNFGTAWSSFVGECSQETAFELLDYFHSMGGNFVDTANAYQDGQSEEWLGEWMAQRNRRDEMVIATKYTASSKRSGGDDVQQSNFGGNSSKSLHISVRQSLRRLQTDYIDLLYVHFFDFTTGIPEMMRSLHHLVAAGQVLYLGISDAPAWIVVEANCYARQHGLTPFSVYQGRWSAAERDFEREIIPMCKYEGMAMAPWGALGGGHFISPGTTKTEGRTFAGYTGKEAQVSVVLDRIAKRKSTLITSVALAYVMHKAPYVFPICGGRKVAHLKSNIEALSLRLSPEDIDEIETAYDFQIGFPHSFLHGQNKAPRGPEDIAFTRQHGHFDFVSQPQPIEPQQLPVEQLPERPANAKPEKVDSQSTAPDAAESRIPNSNSTISEPAGPHATEPPPADSHPAQPPHADVLQRDSQDPSLQAMESQPNPSQSTDPQSVAPQHIPSEQQEHLTSTQ